MNLNGPTLNLLFIGDIVGKGGRKAVRALVPQLKQQYMCTFVIANGENCAAGAGMNKSCLGEMADVVEDRDWLIEEAKRFWSYVEADREPPLKLPEF